MSKKSKISTLVFGALSIAVFIMTLTHSSLAIEYMKKGLKLCSESVIPSLFPFMVISELIVSCGVGERISRIFARPVRLLFGVSESAACAFLLGAICGFPIGASSLSSMYERGLLTKEEFSRSMTFCNNPGSAFVISVAGVSLLGSKKLGLVLYLSLILAAAAVGALGRAFFRKKNFSHETGDKKIPPANTASGIGVFTSAIQNSALCMLTVCAYVLFFSAAIGCLGAMLQNFGVPKEISAMLFGFFELSSGAAAVTEAFGMEKALVLCAVILGWSGLSVHFQIMTVCTGKGISFKPYFIAKAIQGILSGVIAFVLIRLFPSLTALPAGEMTASGKDTGYAMPLFVCTVFFIATVLPILVGSLKQEIVKSRKKMQ